MYKWYPKPSYWCVVHKHRGDKQAQWLKHLTKRSREYISQGCKEHISEDVAIHAQALNLRDFMKQHGI